MQQHLKPSEALLEAANRIEAGKEKFICHALTDLCYDCKIPRHQLNKLKSDISFRLEGRSCLESWLAVRVKGYSYAWTRKTRAHSVAWARQMAAEYAAKGE